MTLSPQRLAAVSDMIAQLLGLYYPPERREELERMLSRAARASGEVGLEAYTDSLLAGPLSRKQKTLLVETLTIGETYFFREPQVFETLARQFEQTAAHPAVPNAVLRAWSAGCCTGEEAYSLAIMFARHRQQFPHPRIEVLATDINPRYLQRAEAAVYGPWSFRDAPAWLQTQYFDALGDGRHQVRAAIRAAVKFTELNLATDAYPSLVHGTAGLDLILCRHVLMYFSPPEFARAVHRFAACLKEGGWLIVSTAEMGQVKDPSLVPLRIGQTTVFVKRSRRPSATAAAASASLESHGATDADFTAHSSANPPTDSAAAAPAPTTRARAVTPFAPPVPRAFAAPSSTAALLATARNHADLGELDAALATCDQLLRQDKLHAVAHFLRASVLKEKGEVPEALRALSRVIYLEPEFIAAYFVLGHLERAEGRAGAAERHWQTARQLASRLPAETLLPEADGLTAGQLLALIPAQAAASTPSPSLRAHAAAHRHRRAGSPVHHR